MLLPDLHTAAAAGDTLSTYTMRQMLRQAAQLPLWQLRGGVLAPLAAGIFASPGMEEPAGEEPPLGQGPVPQVGAGFKVNV